MTEQPYTNREIAEKFEDILKYLTRIEGQTVKTNGRVSKLEIWQGFIKGGLAIIVIIGIPLIIYAFNLAVACRANCASS